MQMYLGWSHNEIGCMSAIVLEYRLVIKLMGDENGTLDNGVYGAIWLLRYFVFDRT